jgi:hypothetical protein
VGLSETLRLTIVYEDGGDGWIVASIPEVPGAHSQGHTRAEARENAIPPPTGSGRAGARRRARPLVK